MKIKKNDPRIFRHELPGYFRELLRRRYAGEPLPVARSGARELVVEKREERTVSFENWADRERANIIDSTDPRKFPANVPYMNALTRVFGL